MATKHYETNRRTGGQPGQRVRVNIGLTWERYAHGAAAALDGKEGVIEQAMPGDGVNPAKYLVRFDEPAAKWWAHQTPPEAWWFEFDELVQVGQPATT